MEKEFKKLLKNNFSKSNKKISKDKFFKTSKKIALNLVSSKKNSIVKSFGKNSRISITGRDSKIASLGDICELSSTGANSYILNKGSYSNIFTANYFNEIDNFGDNVNISNTGTSSIINNYGNCCKIFCSGYQSQIKINGNYNSIHIAANNIKLENLGDSSKIFNFGDKNTIINNSNNITIHEEGNKNQIESFGENCQIFIHGKQTMVKASSGTKVTFVHNYKNYSFIIKDELDYYTLYKDALRKCINFGNVISVILEKKKNIYKLKSIENDQEFYVIKTGNTWVYGDTVEEAKHKFMFKIPKHKIETYLERFKTYTLDTELNLREGILFVMLIEGSCEEGSIEWLNNILSLPYAQYLLKQGFTLKDTFSIRKILKLTYNTRNYEFLIHFFKDQLTEEDINFIQDDSYLAEL